MTRKATASISRGLSGPRSAPPPKPHPVRSAPIAGRCCIPPVAPGGLALTADRVDSQAAVRTFASKKKRRPGLYRAVPVPATLLDTLDLVHGLHDRATRSSLWTWSLKTAFTRIIAVIARAGMAGPYPKQGPQGYVIAVFAWCTALLVLYDVVYWGGQRYEQDLASFSGLPLS